MWACMREEAARAKAEEGRQKETALLSRLVDLAEKAVDRTS